MSDGPPPPPPSSLLRGVSPEVHLLPAGTLLWRVYFRAGAHLGSWNEFRALGPTRARFDHHPPPRREHRQRGILYLSDRGSTCVGEVFQDTRLLDRLRDAPALVAFQTARSLALLDLTGAWPARAGAGRGLASGPRGTAPLWSRAIHAAYPEIEGLRYASAVDGDALAFALYERARSALPAVPALDLPLADAGLTEVLRAEAGRRGYGMV